MPFAKRSQPTGTPTPHQWLLMGVQACRLPAPKPLKPAKTPKTLKTVQTLQKRFGTSTRAGKSHPKARSLACSGRSSLPFARRSQPTGTPRPHQWLLMGVQACRLPAPRRLKPLKPLKRLKPLKLCKSASERPPAQAIATPKTHQCATPNRARKSYPKARSIAAQAKATTPQATSMRNAQPRRQKLPQGQIHRFLWAVQPAVRQAFAANRHPKATSMASYERPSLPFASP